MNTHSSGYYSIDEEYTIIGFNDTAKEIYPNLQKGIKCYKALMGLDSPCPPCPVMNKIYGPRTYLDPIRKIYETVDAVKLKLSDEKVGLVRLRKENVWQALFLQGRRLLG